nr:hypothetical protein [uncultured Desulfuromonas sp.]
MKKLIGLLLLGALMSFVLAACSGGGGGGGSTQPSEPEQIDDEQTDLNLNSRLLFVDNYGSSYSVLDPSLEGQVEPLRSLGNVTGLAMAYSIAVDTVNNEVFVACTESGNEAILVFDRNASDNAAPLRIISGSLTGLDYLQGIAVDPANNELVAITRNLPEDTGIIHVFNRTAQGNVAPLRTISGPSTGIVLPTAVAIDSQHDDIVITDSASDCISFFSRTAQGDTPPRKTISGAATELSAPLGIAIDPLNQEIIVSNRGSEAITVFALTSAGDTVPKRTFSAGTLPVNTSAGQLAVNTDDDEIYILNYYSQSLGGSISLPATAGVATFSRTAEGDVAPLRRLPYSGGVGLTFDSVNNELWLGAYAVVATFAPEAKDDDAPLRRITGNLMRGCGPLVADAINNELYRSTAVYAIDAELNDGPLRSFSLPDLDFPTRSSVPTYMTAMDVDPHNDEIVVTSAYIDAHSAIYGGIYQFCAVSVYPRLVSGEATPSRLILGTATGLDTSPNGVAVDWIHDEIVVLTATSILTFSRTDNGDVPPLRTISGELTELNGAGALKLDRLNNEIFVANSGDDSILVFGRTDDGNLEPLRKISGPSTQLSDLKDLVVDEDNNELFAVNGGMITVYDLDADGDTAPLRTMQTNATGRDIDAPCSITLYTPAGQ